jgi:hypothetical protein
MDGGRSFADLSAIFLPVKQAELWRALLGAVGSDPRNVHGQQEALSVAARTRTKLPHRRE